jgi:hypothetical protein
MTSSCQTCWNGPAGDRAAAANRTVDRWRRALIGKGARPGSAHRTADAAGVPLRSGSMTHYCGPRAGRSSAVVA